MKGTSAFQSLTIEIRFPNKPGNTYRHPDERGTVCYVIAAHATAGTYARARLMLHTLAYSLQKCSEAQIRRAFTRPGAELFEWEHTIDRILFECFEADLDEYAQVFVNPETGIRHSDPDETAYERWERFLAAMFGSDEDRQPKLWTLCTARVILKDGQ